MITLTITDLEKKRLLHFAENTIESGHWGNAEMEVPEEHILLMKIQQALHEIELPFHQVELLFNWLSGATDHGFILLPEDISLLHKVIFQLYGYYEDKKRSYLSELDRISRLIESSLSALPAAKRDLPLAHLKELEKIEEKKNFRKLRKQISGEDSDEEDDATGPRTSAAADEKEPAPAAPARPEPVINRNQFTHEQKPETGGGANRAAGPLPKIREIRPGFLDALKSLFAKRGEQSVPRTPDAQELLKKTESLAKKISKNK